MLFAFIIIISYLLGSVPMGLLLTRAMGRGDLRQVGSGNIGATNVMRVGGLRMAGLVWLLDMGKAICAVWLGKMVGGMTFGAWCGLVAIIGHCWPVWLRFRGGKGISSMFGVMLGINPIIFIVCGIEWLIVALYSGYSSLGAIVTFCLLPIFGFVMSWRIGVVFLAIAILALIRHHENIGRLVGGTESKVEWRWKK